MAAKAKGTRTSKKNNVIKISKFKEDQRPAPHVGAAGEEGTPIGDAPQATDPKPGGDDTPKTGDNWNAVAEARKAALIAAHNETYDLEKQEEALMAKHITPLREARSEIKANLKKQFEVSAGQFNAWHGVYYYDREAESGQDYISMQVIREQAAACPVGGSMDLVDLAEKATKMREEIAAAAKKKATTVETVEHTL